MPRDFTIPTLVVMKDTTVVESEFKLFILQETIILCYYSERVRAYVYFLDA